MEIGQIVPVDPSILQPPLFPKNQRDVPNTILTPARQHLSTLARFRHIFWEFGARLGQPDMKYAIKTGLAGGVGYRTS